MEKTDYMETEQHATKRPMGQGGNQKGNLKIPWDKWKWNHNHTKMYGMLQKQFLEGSS